MKTIERVNIIPIIFITLVYVSTYEYFLLSGFSGVRHNGASQ